MWSANMFNQRKRASLCMSYAMGWVHTQRIQFHLTASVSTKHVELYGSIPIDASLWTHLCELQRVYHLELRLVSLWGSWPVLTNETKRSDMFNWMVIEVRVFNNRTSIELPLMSGRSNVEGRLLFYCIWKVREAYYIQIVFVLSRSGDRWGP